MPITSWLRKQWSDIKGNAKWAFLGVVWWAVVSVGKYLLNNYGTVPPWGAWLIVLFVSALVFLLLARSVRNVPAGQSAVQTGPSVVPVQPTANFDANQFFRLAYYSQMTTEAERNIQLAAAQNQPNDRQDFLARFIGVGVVAYLHDMTWAYIYKSQLLMLTDLNRRAGLMPLADAKPYYDRAAAEHPALYAKYPFERWMQFMKGQQLIIQHASDMLEITVKGRDFLKYLTHWGRHADERVF